MADASSALHRHLAFELRGVQQRHQVAALNELALGGDALVEPAGDFETDLRIRDFDVAGYVNHIRFGAPAVVEKSPQRGGGDAQQEERKGRFHAGRHCFESCSNREAGRTGLTERQDTRSRSG